LTTRTARKSIIGIATFGVFAIVALTIYFKG